MKPQELFGVAVRAVGLYYIVQAIWSVLRILDIVVPLWMSQYEHFESGQRITIATFAVAGVLYLVISAFFLKRADWLVGVAYRLRPDSPRPSPVITEKGDA